MQVRGLGLIGRILAGVLVCLLAGVHGADAGEEDDLERLRKQQDLVKKDLDEANKILSELEANRRAEYIRKGFSCFLDQSHVVQTKHLHENWVVPIHAYRSIYGETPANGVQAGGSWSTKKPGEPEKAIVAVVHRFGHHRSWAGKELPDSTRIDASAEPVLHSKPLEMIAAMHRVHSATLLPPPESPPPPAPGQPAPELEPALAKRLADARACKAPGSRSVGVTKYFAAAQGTDKESGKRSRREWYAWSGKDSYKGRDTTWVLSVRFDESALDDANRVALGKDFAEAIAK